MGAKELDALILRTLLIDGEVFIRIHRRSKNPYGLSFEIIDAASIDYTKKREFGTADTAVIMGIEVDRKYKPLKYYVRSGTTTVYQAGTDEVIPASDMIHLYKKEFPQQVRGFPALNSCLNDLKQLEEYQTAELVAAKVGAVLSIFYEPNNNSPEGRFLSEEDGDSEFVQELSPGQASIVPKGYSVKSISSSHPNSNFGSFVKSVLKKTGASLGISYNQLCKDYESVNFSSLREGAADSKTFFEATQTFLIEAWKEIEYKLFLEALVLNTDFIKATDVKEAMRYHNFICAKRAWYDPSRDILATKYALEIGVKNPLQVIEENGNDPNEVLDGWSLWNKMCTSKELNFSENKSDVVLDPVEDKSDEEQMNEDGRKN